MSDLNLEIKVPDNKKQILIDGSSGDIDINDLKAVELDIDLSSGSISLEKIMTDEFSYSISSGNIDIEEMTTGKLQGQASSGRIDASSLISGSTEIESLSGKIMLDFKELNGDVRLSASSGRIELRLPKDSDFSYDLVASSGDIRNTFSGSNIDADNYLSGTVKTGKYKIDVRTSSGDITIS